MRRVRGAACAMLILASCSPSGDKADDSTAAAKPHVARSLLGGGPYLYVSGEDGNSVAVIDVRAESVVASMAPGRRPRGVRVSPDGSTLIVAVSGSPKGGPGVDESKLPPADHRRDGIALMDLPRRVLRKTLSGGVDPENFDVSKDGKTIYVANEDAGTVTVLDVVSSKPVATIPVGREPEGVTISPDSDEVYVTNEADGTVSIIATDSRVVIATIAVGKRPRSVTFSLDGAKAYVANEEGGSVSVIDTDNRRVKRTIALAGPNVRPMGTALSPDGARLYVTTGRGGTLVVVDTKGDSATGSVAVGKRPWGVAVSDDGTRIYTANGPSNDVSVIDAATLKIVRRIPAGSMPWGVALSK
jgi:YVTN family beta-propeller protein